MSDLKIEDIEKDYPMYPKDSYKDIRRFKDFESIVIPYGTKRIGENVFYGCEKLKNVEIPNTIEEICDYAFARCPNLKIIEIPKNTKVSKYVFGNI